MEIEEKKDHQPQEIEIIDEHDLTVEILPSFEDFTANNKGRPTKYNEDMPRILWEYFMKPRIAKKYRRSTYHGKEIQKVYYEAEKFPTVEAFCVLQCIHKDTFYEWIKQHKDFSDAYSICKMRQKDVLVQNILEGEWGVKSGVFISLNYTDLTEAEREIFGDGGVEETPKRLKGYDLSKIDSYCKDSAIETTATEVKNG